MAPRTSRSLVSAAFAAVVALAFFMALVVPWVIGLYQTPTYEATVKILVSQRSTEDTNLIQDIPLALPDLTLTVAKAVLSEPVAKAVVEQLNLPEASLSTREVLANMTVEPEPGTMFINISYKDSDPKRAQLAANTIGEVSSQKISDVMLGANPLVARVWQPATLPKTPVSPNPVLSAMLLALATWGLMLGLLITARACAGGNLSFARLPQKNVFPDYTAGEPRLSLEAAKEQELLEALGRSPSGELTAAGAALETSLTVEEADRMLSRLAAKGHLRVRASESSASGGLFYSFWPTE